MRLRKGCQQWKQLHVLLVFSIYLSMLHPHPSCLSLTVQHSSSGVVSVSRVKSIMNPLSDGWRYVCLIHSRTDARILVSRRICQRTIACAIVLCLLSFKSSIRVNLCSFSRINKIHKSNKRERAHSLLSLFYLLCKLYVVSSVYKREDVTVERVSRESESTWKYFLHES